MWWNSFDFATLLAYMIIPDDKARSRLRKHLSTILLSRIKHVTAEIHGTTMRGGMLSIGGCISTITVAEILAMAGIAASAGPLVTAFWALGMGSIFSAPWRDSAITRVYMPRWKNRLNQLARRFPVLQGLICEDAPPSGT